MSLLAAPIISIMALLLVIVIGVFFYIKLTRLADKIARLSAQVETAVLLNNDLQMSQDHFQEKLNELQRVNHQQCLENQNKSQAVTDKINVLINQVDEHQQLLISLQSEQGENKFYTRAYKLAAMGASVDEIMTECELPKAEVEMLLALYRQKVRV